MGGAFEAVGLNYKDLSAQRRNDLIEMGLHRWRRPVRSVNGRCKYLGTVAMEGGLPLKQLQESGGWLRNVLQPTLRKHLTRSIDISVLISSCEDQIPSSYRSFELKQILTDIAYSIVRLRCEYNLKNKPDPINWLDSNHPHWRDSLPLPMDDSQAVTLITELIETAVSASANNATVNPFEVERFIVRADTESTEFVALINVPAFVTIDAINENGQCNILPASIDLEVYEPGGDSWPLCRAFSTVYREKPTLKLSGKPLRLTGRNAIKTLHLRFKSIGETLAEIPLAGGSALDCDQPWLFRHFEGKWVFNGSASQSVKDDTAIAYIPGTCNTLKTEQDNTMDDYGRLLGGRLIKFSGIVFCRSDDAKYKLSTGTGDNLIHYELKGKKCQYASNPKELYIGSPEMIETSLVHGSTSRSHHDRLLSKRVGTKDWHPLSVAAPGYHEIRLTDADGNVQLRKRIGLLSEDFQVHIKPDRNDAKAGKITLTGLSDMEVSIEQKGVAASVSAQQQGYDINVKAESAPPLNLNVLLYTMGQSKPLSISLPYPSNGALLFDSKGTQVSPSVPLYLSDLHGYRLKVFDDKFTPGQKINLLFTLFDQNMSHTEQRDICIERHVRLSAAMTEFTLLDWHPMVDALIGVSTSIDSIVRLNVMLRGQRVYTGEFCRYKNELLINNEEGTIGLDPAKLKQLSADDLAGAKVSVLYLMQPEQKFKELSVLTSQGVALGQWMFHPEQRQDGPWIIYPSPDSSLQFRPTLWAVRNQTCNHSQPDNDAGTLAAAMLIENADKRANQIKMLLKAMANEPEHRSWKYLFNLWEKTSHLPITTFDVWKLCISESAFLASLFIHNSCGVIERLGNELPVIWELVALKDWKKALLDYKNRISEKLDDDELTYSLLSKKIENIESQTPAMLSIGKILRADVLALQCPELQALKHSTVDALLSPQLNDLFQNLLRCQADSEWPKILMEELEYQMSTYPKAYIELIRPSHRHQASLRYSN